MSAKAQDYHKRLTAFMTEFVFSAESSYEEYRREAGPNEPTADFNLRHSAFLSRVCMTDLALLACMRDQTKPQRRKRQEDRQS